MSPVDFRAIFDASPNAYMLLDRRLCYVAANRAYLELTASDLSQLLGRHLFDLFPNDPDDPTDINARQLRESFETVLRTRRPHSIAFLRYHVAKTPGGPALERVWSCTHTPIFDTDGEVSLILQHTVDVSDLQHVQAPERNTAQAEAGVLHRAREMAESNRVLGGQIADLRNVFDQAPGFVCFLRGPKLVYEISNHAYNQMVGRDDLIGKPIREALPELADQGYFELLEEVLRTGEPFVGRGMRVQLSRPPSMQLEDVIVDFVYQPIIGPDGAPLGILVQGNDITEHSRQQLRQRFLTRASECLGTMATDVEEALRELARAAVPSFADWAFIDLFERDHYRRLFVVPPDSSHAELARQVSAYPPRADHGPEHIRRAYSGAQATLVQHVSDSVRAELAVNATHRALVDAIDIRSLLAVPLHSGPNHFGVLTFGLSPGRNSYDGADLDLAKELARMVAIGLDNTRLSREHSELLRSEQVARERAESANQAKDEFLAMLGHELRNPLAPILTAVQLMKLRDASESARERVIIERQAQHLVRLVDDLLDVSRIARGKVELRKTATEIGSAVAKAVEIISPLLEEKRHTLELDVPLEGLCVYGDEARLSQIVANLLSNSARYTPAHGAVSLRARREADEIVIRVRDNGVGIPADMLPRVFDLFVQSPQHSDRAEGGLGLGLTLVRNLVVSHGGTVTATSDGPGKGSEFVVRLPLLDGPVPHGRPSSVPTPLPVRPQRAKVLVVDDNVDAAELLAALLARHGYVTHVASDGPAAITAAQSFAPDLAILDIGLPVMDGYELAARLRDGMAGSAPRLIALTGYGQEHDRARAIAAGFFAHIVKPVDAELLLRTLAAAETR